MYTAKVAGRGVVLVQPGDSFPVVCSSNLLRTIKTASCLWAKKKCNLSLARVNRVESVEWRWKSCK